MSPELAFRLGRVTAALRGPASLRPLDVLVAAHETQAFDAAAYTQLTELAAAQQRTIRILERRLKRAENPSARRLFERLDAQNRELRDLKRPLGETAPALEKWRQQLLASPRRTPLERAAAWELTALDCDRRGQSDQAGKCRQQARALLLVPTANRVA